MNKLAHTALLDVQEVLRRLQLVEERPGAGARMGRYAYGEEKGRTQGGHHAQLRHSQLPGIRVGRDGGSAWRVRDAFCAAGMTPAIR